MTGNDAMSDSQVLQAVSDSVSAIPTAGRPALAQIWHRSRVQRRRRLLPAAAAAGSVAAVTAGVMALGSAPAVAAYSVTRHANGTVTVSVNRPSGIAGADAALHRLRARVVVVPVRPGCPPIGSLPRPRPAPHPSVMVGTGVSGDGHRLVTVKIGKGGIPKGDTMILAFSGSGGPGRTSLGAGGIITGPVPRCVSLPPAP
jgi:hypothetical protein